MRALEIITGHVIYNPAYTYKFQLKTTLDGCDTCKIICFQHAVKKNLIQFFKKVFLKSPYRSSAGSFFPFMLLNADIHFDFPAGPLLVSESFRSLGGSWKS